MVETSSCQNCWNSEIKTLHSVVGFDYFQNYRRIRVDSGGNRANDLLKKSASHDIEDEIDKPSIFNVDHRLNSIFQMCLEPGLGDHPSLTSPKNFVVQYFTVSRNHPIKACRRTQCPFAGQGLRTQGIRQQPACSKLPPCKRSQIATQDQFSHCDNRPDEIQNALAELSPRTTSLKKSDDSERDDNVACSLGQGYSSTSSSSSCCTSGISDVKSLMRKKRHTLQQTDPEQSWQARCSNFIINLPLTLSDKLFGPRTTCEGLLDGKRTVCDDSGINSSQPVPENTSKPSSRDQGNKKSVKSRVSSLADRGCHKNIGTDRVLIEKANQVDPCYLTTTQSVPESVPCGISSRNLEKRTITRKKVTSECGKSREDRFPHLDGVSSRGSEPNEPWLKRRVRNKTSSSISNGKKRRKSSLRISNWPAILSEKIFGPRNEKVLRFCVVDNGVRHAKATDGVADNTEIVSKISKPSSEKNGRLLLKKYTISRTPEAVEETLCFDILTGEQLTELKPKLESRVCVKRTSEDKRKLETIQERNEVLTKCLGTNGSSRSSKRCTKSKGNANESSLRRTEQLEKKTSTEHIFLSSLIMKLLNMNRDDKCAFNEKKSHRNTVSGQNRDKRNERERKCAFKPRANTVSRKYAATSIHKRRNESIKRPRYGGKHSQRKETGSRSLERNVLCPDCRAVNFSDISGEDQTRKRNSSDFSNGREEISKPDDSLEGAKDFCCVKRSENESIDEEEYQDCDSRGSSKVRKGLVKSGALQMTAESCRREPGEFCCVGLHRGNRKEKSYLREKCSKRIISRKKFPCEGRRLNDIEYNDPRLACRGRRDCETMEEGFCTQRHRDLSASKNGLENYGNIDSILTPMERRSRKRCHGEKFPKARVCQRLLIFKENEIPDPKKNRMFSIADENICPKMFHDRETSTDDFLGSAYCQSSKCAGEIIPNRKLLCTQTTLGVDMESVKNRSPSGPKIEQNGIVHVIQSPNGQGSSQNSVGFSPLSKSPEEGPFLEQNGNGSMQKPPENAMRIRVGCEEFLGSFCEDDACRVRPGGIPECEDILEAKQDVGKVFSSLWQEVCGEDGNPDCGGETCLYKTLIKSEPKDAPGILKGDEFCQRQSIPVQSSSKVNHCSSSLATEKFCSPDQETHNLTNESRDKYKGANDDPQLLKSSSRKSEQPDEVNPEMNISEKRSSRIKSPGKDLAVTRPESRNIINSYYSQKKSTLVSRCELPRNNMKVKKGKIQQDGSASGKSITKARKPFQRIENLRRADCAAAIVLINDAKSEKRDVVESENSTVNKKSRYTQGGSLDVSKDHLIQNVQIDASSLANDPIAVSTPDDASSIQKVKETHSSNPKPLTPASKIPKKSRPLIKNLTSERVSTSATKAPESSSVNLKESSRKNWSKKGNSATATERTDAKGGAKEAGKISRISAESESSNRICTRSIDTCDSKGSEGQKEFKALAAYISDKENIKPRTLRMEMSGVKEQKIPYDAVGKGASRNAKRRESSESSESSSLRRNCERREDDRSGNSSAAKEEKGNKQTKENQSKSETRSKKNEKDKKSTPLKLLSQIDSKIDSSRSTQRGVTMNADLFASALMDGKNNIESYRDLQSAGEEENSNSDRISGSKDEGLRKSGTATIRGKSKVSKSYKSGKTNAKSTPEESKIHKKSKYSKENIDKNTANRADEDGPDKISSRTSSASVHMENSNEEFTQNSGHNEVNVTAADSLSIEVNNVEPCRSCIVSENIGNCEIDLKLRSSPRNSKEVEVRIQKQHSLANKSNVKKNPIADRHFEERCAYRIAESKTLPKNISSEKSSAYTTSRVSNNERLSCEFGISLYHTKTGRQTLASMRSSDTNKKTKQETRGDARPPGSPPSKPSEDRNALKSNHAHARVQNMVNVQKQGIHRSTRREKKGKELITEIENSLVSEVKCEKYTDAECNGTDSKKLWKVLKNSNSVEENRQIEQHDDVPDELTTFRTPEIIISNSSADRNFRFTDDLKRFFDQGQEFFHSKRKKKSNETTLYSDGRQELTPWGGCKSNESEACCTKTTKFCKSVDYEKLKKPLKICDDDRASNNSISSLQKAYSTLKNILNKTKNIQKSFTNAKQTKETQIYTSILDEQSHIRQRQTSQKCKLL